MQKLVFRSDVQVELIDSMVSDDMVAAAARVSTATDLSSHTDPAGLISWLVRDRHGSPFEHGTFVWRVEAPIFVWREHMRHRIASYNELSGRYAELQPHFYVPDGNRNLTQEGKPGHYRYLPGTDEQHMLVDHAIKDASTQAYRRYEEMLRHGIAREVARMVLPVNIYSSAYVTMNPRALMNFLSLRRATDDTTYPTHPQREIEMVAERYEDDFARLMPATHAAFVAAGRVAP